MPSTLTIGDVVREFGLATSAIRYYEDQGLLPRAARRSGRRVYSADIFPRLSVIELAKAAGFTIREIRELLNGCTGQGTPGPVWRQLARRKLGELQQSIDNAQRMQAILSALLACECPTLNDCGTEAATAAQSGDADIESRARDHALTT